MELDMTKPMRVKDVADSSVTATNYTSPAGGILCAVKIPGTNGERLGWLYSAYDSKRNFLRYESNKPMDGAEIENIPEPVKHTLYVLADTHGNRPIVCDSPFIAGYQATLTVWRDEEGRTHVEVEGE